MIKDVVEHVGGIGLYGMLSLLLFFAVFLGVILWALRLDRDRLEAAARLPLDPNPAESRKEESHE